MQNSNGSGSLKISLVNLILCHFPYLENYSFLIKDNVGIHSTHTESTHHYFFVGSHRYSENFIILYHADSHTGHQSMVVRGLKVHGHHFTSLMMP